jgi:surface antigen
MKKLVMATVTGAMLLTSTGCSQNGGQDGGITKEQVGSVAGAIGGAWLGSNLGKGKGQIVGIAAGTLLGTYIGNQVGQSLDKADLKYYEQTSQYSLEETKTDQTSEWANPDTGNSGTITPTRTYQLADNTYCREYTQTINVGGKTVEGYGTACRQPDGTWKIKEK